MYSPDLKHAKISLMTSKDITYEKTEAFRHTNALRKRLPV